MNAADRQKHLEMLRDPSGWPMWPMLPLKRMRDDVLEAGCCVTADYPTIVLKQFPTMKGVLLQMSCEDGVPVPGSTMLRQATDAERDLYEAMVLARYEDLDGLLDAEWRID